MLLEFKDKTFNFRWHWCVLWFVLMVGLDAWRGDPKGLSSTGRFIEEYGCRLAKLFSPPKTDRLSSRNVVEKLGNAH